MIIGIGTDIAQIARFTNKSEHFVKRVLSIKEYEIFLSLNNTRKIEYLASRFSAKEAIFKAFKNLSFDFASVSVLNKENGAPYVEMETPYKIHISLSHEKDYVVTYVVVEA